MQADLRSPFSSEVDRHGALAGASTDRSGRAEVTRNIPGRLQLLDKTQERIMTKLKVVLALAAAAVVASTFAPAEASARWRRHTVGCFDRLPAYGYDGCGLREFGYGPDSCWDRREAYTRQGPRASRVWVCGRFATGGLERGGSADTEMPADAVAAPTTVTRP